MNKRGASHIEVMMSFLIFVGFVIFAFYFFSPTHTGRFIDSSLGYVYDEIYDYARTNVKSYSLSLFNLDDDKVKKKEYLQYNFQNSNLKKNYKVRVENYKGEKIKAFLDEGDKVIFEKENIFYGREENEKGFVKILFSEDFSPEEKLNGAFPINSFAKISSSENFEYISEKKINNLKDKYEKNYDELKKDFNLPKRMEFGFELNLKDKKIKTEKKPPENVNIYTKGKKIEVLRENGKIEFAELIVKIW